MGSSPSKSIEDVRTSDIASFVASLGNNFKAYEDSIRQSGLSAQELSSMDDETLELVLTSLSINNRLHRRKLASVCRKRLQLQLQINDEGDYDTCSSTTCSSHNNSIGSPPPRRRSRRRRSLPSLLSSLPDESNLNNNKYSTHSASSCQSGAASNDDGSYAGGSVSSIFESFSVAQSAEALSLLVDMENQKRLLSHNSRPSGPPEGRAAIVLTDVEGSTELWEADPVAMRAALNLHDDTIRMIRADHGGYEVDTEGDAFYMAFHTANDALSFALALQEALREASWPKNILAHPRACEDGRNRGLRVRVTIHMGPVTTRRNAVTGRIEYTGETMDKAREIEAMVEGGQILTTRSTFESASIAAPVEDKGDGIVQVCPSKTERRVSRRERRMSRRPSLGASSVRSLRSISSDRRLSRRRQKRRSSIKKSVAGGDEAAKSTGKTRRMKRSTSMPMTAAVQLNESH